MIEQIAAAQKDRTSSGLKPNKPDWAMRFFFMVKVMGVGAEWDEVAASVYTFPSTGLALV